MFFILASVFLFGLVVGSFLNVVILRGNRGESFFKGRSRCQSCSKELAWFELIPLVEFATGVLFAAAAWLFFIDSSSVILSATKDLTITNTGILRGVYPEFIEWAQNDFFMQLFNFLGVLVIISAAIVILVSDTRWQIIPNGPVLILFLAGLVLTVWRAAVSGSFAYNFAIEFGSAFLVAFFFFALWFLSKGAWMGFGDVKLVFATSLILGFPVSVAAVLFSFWIGAIFGILLLIFKKVNLKTRIPFGPFLLAGSAAAYFYSETALWYIGLSSV